MSYLDHSNNQLQLSKEDEEEDQDRYLEGDECQVYSRLHSSSNFHPPVQLHGRLQGKPEVHCCQQKLRTLVASSALTASKQQSTRFTKLGDKDQSFGQKEPRIGQKRAKGDNDEEEGYITHSIISKQKHNKVSTSKGLRDRRVRLSATTAIDFYDLQDRLGFDRPSKAIDWLMKKAKVAIDALNNKSKIAQFSYQEFESHVPSQIYHQPQQESTFLNPEYDIQNQQNLDDNPYKFSFISMICGSSSSTSMNFHKDQHVMDPRIRSQSQDICLTIQSSQEDPTLHQEYLSTHSFGEHQQSHLSSSTPVNVNTMSSTGWFQRMISQSSNSKYCAAYSSERSFEQILDQNQLFYQREPLQSTLLPSRCAALTNTQLPNIDYHPMPSFNSASVTCSELAYKEFSVAPKIQCQQVAVDPTSNRSSSASSFLHYDE